MDYLLYWLDRGDWIAFLQHTWIWALIAAVLSVVTVCGIAVIGRHYDERERADGGMQA